MSADRLREWADDANHVVQSVRFYQPTYANPAEIRSDVRDLLARTEAAEAQRDTLIQARNEIEETGKVARRDYHDCREEGSHADAARYDCVASCYERAVRILDGFFAGVAPPEEQP